MSKKVDGWKEVVEVCVGVSESWSSDGRSAMLREDAIKDPDTSHDTKPLLRS